MTTLIHNDCNDARSIAKPSNRYKLIGVVWQIPVSGFLNLFQSCNGLIELETQAEDQIRYSWTMLTQLKVSDSAIFGR